MPKNEIDYTNTIIYKITCNDPLITDLYVGHTTNFVQRKHGHKQSCINIKSPNYKCKLYEVIRANGGWKNWKMEIIYFFECKNADEARKKEQEYFILLNATLNSIEPYATSKPKKIEEKVIKNEFNCNLCNKKFINQDLLDIHNNTKNHISQKNNKKYNCELCKYWCCTKTEYNKHLSTNKHLNNYNYLHENLEKLPKLYSCSICNKSYKFRQNVYTHKKKCNNAKQEQNTTFKIEELKDQKEKKDNELSSILMDLVKSNAELQEQMLELIAVNKLPLHCSDAKRRILYIKEKNKWKKEDPDNEYMKLVKEATNGSKENLIKVIKRISKEVLIKKEHHRH